MKVIVSSVTVALLLISEITFADAVKPTNKPAPTSETTSTFSSLPLTEPVSCYKLVWEQMGITAGQAVELCSGTLNAGLTAACFLRAWANPADGGLGLTAGQAVELCKTK